MVSWAQQGVRENYPNSHSKIWREFSKNIIKEINSKKENVVYILWGAHAQSFTEFIDESKNCILTWSHPSPLSRKQFFGNNHFIDCNVYLKEHGIPEINWINN